MASKPHGGRALFTLVRFWSRRWMSPWKDMSDQTVTQVQSVLVLEAIDSLSGDRSVSIADVARSLAIDHSVASRMVARAAQHELILKTRSQNDPRQILLSLTSKGESILADAHIWQENVFKELTRDWSRAEADQLAKYLSRLANALPTAE